MGCGYARPGEDDRGAVEHRRTDERLKLALLGGAQLLVADHQIGLARAELRDGVESQRKVLLVVELLADDRLGSGLRGGDEGRLGLDPAQQRLAFGVEGDTQPAPVEVADQPREARNVRLANGADRPAWIWHHTIVTPPSATMTWPVMNAAASDNR